MVGDQGESGRMKKLMELGCVAGDKKTWGRHDSLPSFQCLRCYWREGEAELHSLPSRVQEAERTNGQK